MNLQRHRSGEPNLVPILAKASTAILIGGICIMVSNNATNAGDATYGANTAASVQLGTHTNFVGVSIDQRLSANATAGNIVVGTSGVWEFDCLDEDIKPMGTLYGVGVLAGGTNQASEIVQSVATTNLSIGRLARVKAANATTCFLEIVASVTRGGVQAVA